MPLYTYTCSCGSVRDEFRTISTRDDSPECHGKMTRIMCYPSLVMGDIEPYISMVDGSIIHGRREHREHLRGHRLIEVGDQVHHLKSYGTYKPDAEVRKQNVVEAVHKVMHK